MKGKKSKRPPSGKNSGSGSESNPPRISVVLRAFGLRAVPTAMPYDAGFAPGLVLPETLTRTEMMQIGAGIGAEIVDHPAWYLGDLLLWITNHPDNSPVTLESMRERFYKCGLKKRTQQNRQSVATTFPLKDRNPLLTYNHHAAVQGLPEQVRKELLERAFAENLPAPALTDLAQVWKMERDGIDPDRAIVTQLKPAVVNLLSALDEDPRSQSTADAVERVRVLLRKFRRR